MRRRLMWGTVAVITAVLVALVPPVVILLRRAAERELEVRLSSQASSVSVTLADDLISGTTPGIGSVAPMIPAGDELIITDATGEQVLHYGDHVTNGITGSAAGPGGTTVLVRTDRAALDRRVRAPLVALGAFAIGSIGLGAVLAWLVGRRLTRPLDHLAVAAARLGEGDFSAPMPTHSGLPEIDGIGAALGASARRIDDMLTAERSFTGDATHQLRTGLAGIGLQLELLARVPDADVRATAEHAHAQVERLTTQLDELLELARGGAGRQRSRFDLRTLVGNHCRDWRVRFEAEGRPLELRGEASTVRATPGFAGQIIDILIDNALRHGRGAVTVEVLPDGVRVSDRGAVDPVRHETLFVEAVAPAAPHGRGLALARRLARADGGSLELVTADPTTFELRYLAP